MRYPERISQSVESSGGGIRKEISRFDDGITIEVYQDQENSETLRYYVKDASDHVLEYIDVKAHQADRAAGQEIVDRLESILMQHGIGISRTQYNILYREIEQDLFKEVHDGDNVTDH